MAGQQQTTYPTDGESGFPGGQDASKSPDQVRPGYVYASINTTFKNGTASPRDAFVKHSLLFPEGGVSIDGKAPVPYKTIFESGKYQAIIPYSIGDTPFQIIIVSGVIFLLNQKTLQLQVVTPTGPRLNQYADRFNWSLAARYVVIFDYPLYPIIIQGLTARRANPANFEVPISTNGAYNQNRLFIVNNSNEFTAGDPTGSRFTPDAPITFEEIEVPGAPYRNQIFKLPTSWQNNPITAVGFLQLVDTSTGIGPFIVATNSQISAFQTQLPRVNWDQTNTFGQIIVESAGIAGPRAFTNVNSDLFFISNDGQIRSLSVSRDEQRKWSKVPLSREVSNWLIVQDPALLQFSTMEYFNNKIFVTANPYRVTARSINQEPVWDYAFGGMVVIELDNISNLQGDSPPTWGGLWTGFNPMDFSTNDHRCFVMAKDGGINSLWEIVPSLDYDVAGEQKRLIKSTIYTRNYNFNNPFEFKNLLLGEFPFNNVMGKFKFDLSYRPSSASNFLPWRSFSHEAPFELCEIPWNCPNGLAAQNLDPIRFGAPLGNGCDPITGKEYSYFTRVQLKLEITGVNWELPFFKMDAKTVPQATTNVTCGNFNKVGLCYNCNTDWKIDPFGDCSIW